MRGRLVDVMPYFFDQVMVRQAEYASEEAGYWIDLFREITSEPEPELSEDQFAPPANADQQRYVEQKNRQHQEAVRRYAEGAHDPSVAMDELRDCFYRRKLSESAAVLAVEHFLAVCADYDDDRWDDKPWLDVQDFCERYSIRYELVDQSRLRPTLTGLVASLLEEVRLRATDDLALAAIFEDFNASLDDLYRNAEGRKLRQGIVAKFKVLEGSLRQNHKSKAINFKEMVKEVCDLPHASLTTVIEKLWHLVNDYPNLRHPGRPESANRDVELKDFISLTTMVCGVLPYTLQGFDAERVLRG